MLGHTTSIFNPIRTGGVLNASSRVVLQDRSGLGQKGAGQPLCLLCCRAGSKCRAGSGTEGTLPLFAGLCTGAAQHLILTCVEGRNLNTLRRCWAGSVPWGKTESEGDDPPIPLPSGTGKSHQGSRARSWTDRQTDSLPHRLHLPGKVGCWHLKADEGNFSSYSITSFNSLAFPYTFLFHSLNDKFSWTDRNSGTDRSAVKS